MSGLRLVVGLGNPGPEHKFDRHNAGYWFADALAARCGEQFRVAAKLHGEDCQVGLDGGNLRILKPATYMNRSGQSVVAALNYYRIEPDECLVVHDDLDLSPGTARLKFDGGHGGQNGLRDIIEKLGHAAFHRLRIGIGHPGHRDRVTPWVLGRPSADDQVAMIDAIADTLNLLPMLLRDEYDAARKQLHTKAP